MTKKLLAFVLAALLLLTLFSACTGNVPDDGEPDQGAKTPEDGAQTPDTSGDAEKQDEPEENEPMRLTYLGRENHGWTFTYEEALNKGFESIDYYNDLMLRQQNLIVEVTPIDNEAYKTTLAGYIAANTMTDAFISETMLDDAMLVQVIAQGKFADIDDIIACSDDNTFNDQIAPGGPLEYIKAWSTAPDGHWYMIKCVDGGRGGLDMDTEDTDYLVNFSGTAWYNLNIRQDWLRKCSLSMPTTTAEFKEALIQFQEQDANGSGSKDERAMLGIGMSVTEGTVFSSGTAGWFGLPRDNFVMDATNGEIVSAVEGEGYLPFVQYTGELYNAGVALMSEGGSWQYGALCAGNYCAAMVGYAENFMTVETGDSECEYTPMPIIQALEGVTPHLLGQASGSGNRGLSFRADVDREAAAAYIDWLHSKEFYMLLTYGIEGKTWEFDENGKPRTFIIGAEVSQDDEYRYGDLWCYAPWGLFPQIQNHAAWSYFGGEYASIQEALDAGEPYTAKNQTFETWAETYSEYNWTDMSPYERMMRNIMTFGEDNIHFDMHVNFTTLASEEESAVVNTYQNDLLVYLDEMTTGYITGVKSTDTYAEDLQYAYENLGFQEYSDVMQARVDRYLVTLGREPILG